MVKFESELTRRYLLNSHSRGSLEEVASEKDVIDMELEGREEEADFNMTAMFESNETLEYIRQYHY